MKLITYAALALLLLVPDVASAQRWNGGGRGGNSGWSRGGSWNGGRTWGGGYYGNRWYYPGVSFGWYGYGSPGYSYYYESPTYNYDPSARTSSYYDPAAEVSQVSPNRAQVTIQVPDANAELLIQGQRMTLMGNQRVFVSPDLEPGKTYTYTITMRRTNLGRTEDDTRQVEVQAGTNTRVDFTRPQSQNLPVPQQK